MKRIIDIVVIIFVITACKAKEPAPPATQIKQLAEKAALPAKEVSDKEAAKALFPKTLNPVTGKYHGNTRTYVLHGPRCPSYNCKYCTVGFRSVRKGIKKGYKPHSCIAKKKKRKDKGKRSFGPR